MDQFMDPFFETFRFSSVLLHSRRGEFLSTRSVIIQRIKRGGREKASQVFLAKIRRMD